MSADTELQGRVAFYLTGRRPAGAHDTAGLRPALMAGFGDLAMLRHDFPLVLATQGDAPLQSLRALVDAAIERIAQGADANRLRRQALRMEQEVRVLLAEGARGTLGALWDQAAGRLAAQRDASFTDCARRARAAMATDGELLAFDGALPARALMHVWQRSQQRKSAALRQRLVRLIQGLSDILRAEFERSAAGRTAAHLQSSVGTAHEELFDFDAMSRLLAGAAPRQPMPESRRQRIRQLLSVLDSQPFVALPDEASSRAAGGEVYGYAFDSCEAALAAWNERQPRLVELARAATIAELEIEGQYHAERHDALFESFGANGLEPEEMAQYPDYLVCLDGGTMDAAEQSRLMDILAGELPIKLLYRIDDLMAPSGGGGLHARQIVHMAMGLNQVYVLQSAASHLFHWRRRIGDGMDFAGPALFCVFTGVRGGPDGQAPYLTAAAAMESRAFPAFVYDPSAGPNWASRFSLEGNPQPELDWPIHRLDYEDHKHQRTSRDMAFTFVDFAAGDPRFAAHLARLPSDPGDSSLVAVDEALARERRGLPEQVPCVRMIDGEDRLHVVLVDERALREARRCREMWHSLQELGGVHNSHAERLLQRERAAWDERHAQEAAVAAAALPAAAVPAAAAAAPAPSSLADALPPEPERSRDEAYIESERCSTCNECTQLNPRMFAYNANQQATIVDLKAGTYAQLVEAAENCQVAVIHPGAPWDKNEPGLEELLKRAEPFR